ncbi:acylphosphatase [Corynebacterium sp. 11A]|uniref:acylphosphatase n=1 Tax=Corynebacterium sp. 11A TaxID=2080510 RepID=UPI00124D8A8B|nr:acylphosphatase [Corynebacterium sp. 11A]
MCPSRDDSLAAASGREPDASHAADAAVTRVTAWVHGHVQGVGFRWWTLQNAKELGLAGYAKNLVDGRVCVVAEGTETAVAELVQRLSEQPSSHHRPGSVETVIPHYTDPRGASGFHTR